MNHAARTLVTVITLVRGWPGDAGVNHADVAALREL
jgi:hypothetical protein